MGTSTTNRDETVKLFIQLAMGATTIAPILALLLLGIVAAALLRGGAATLLVLLMLGGIITVIVATLLIHRSVTAEDQKPVPGTGGCVPRLRGRKPHGARPGCRRRRLRVAGDGAQHAARQSGSL